MKKPFAITLDPGSSLHNHTGSWRTQRPTYVDRLPPCNATCPAGEDVQRWLYHAEAGDYRAAWEAILDDNPLPAVMGRACYHTCEGACNRAQLDEAVGIHAVERFLGDLAIREGWPAPAPAAATGKRVLVVGAGPSGLAAAYHLARLGHDVTIRDAMPRAGGMMRYGIPRYRLPREIVDAEIERIVTMGVRLELGVRVDDLPAAMRDGGFDACFAAVGAHLAKRVDIPAADAGKILDAIGLLRQVEGLGDAPLLGRRVVVYGGGNTALDVARTAKRLGATDAVIVYRRTQAQMPAHEDELREALEEGVLVRWLSTVKEMGEGELTIEKMTLGADGKPVPTGELETIAGDTLVLALGQAVDLTPLRAVPGVRFTPDGSVEVGPDLMTGYPGLFCGGDMVPADRTITVAVGHGKKAARHIDAYLRGGAYEPAAKHAPAGFDRLNTWYYVDADRTVQPQLEMARRVGTFAEVHGGLDETTALFEARRCLSCGNCFECDNCFGVCPDNAVIKLGPGKRFRFDLDFCKGCGVCARECPCGAIEMVAEEI
ncbi:MAG: NAD(P)-binding protein [Kofleriaceae bacterium]|nr:NAD(P)-binding protein [Myxococcales bacterium]MCB9558902.1 NAD(P)-binding protein [Kofleriaceae bacterium]MCB9570540.1 NAD(P)-binding protein [Kofleriaceae bacterium]